MVYSRRKFLIYLLNSILCISAMCSCHSDAGNQYSPESKTVTESGNSAKRDNTPQVLVPTADGITVYETEEVHIDASNISEGYFMAKYTGNTDKIRILLSTPLGNTYNYLLSTTGDFEVFPLSDGNGNYQIRIYEHVVDDKYAELFSQEITVSLTDDKKGFLYPNQYVNFNSNSAAVQKGKDVVADAGTDLEAVEAVFTYVTQNVTYDYDKAATVKSGYLPSVDETLSSGKGICFDYASLMAAMLRSQRIPTRLEIGYAGDLYHAWISVYIEESGWIENYIVFDGTTWVLMDPTLVSTAKASTVKEKMEQAETYYDMMYKY